MISDCIVYIVLMCAVVAKVGEVCYEWFILLRLAGMELGKNILPADIKSSGNQAVF